MAQYYFNEDRASPNEPERCVLCGTYYDLVYCSTCDEYFCPVDVADWSARTRAAIAKKRKHLMEKFV